MSLKPWREIAIPHADVLTGTFLPSQFAADITAVHSGKAPPEYQDAKAFFERTYITEGMRLLLTQVARRLSGHGGDPVIQLQTAFGGGKTHTMLAVLHLATRACPLSDLQGIPSLVEQAGLMDVPTARVAVIDGTAHAPGQPWKRGRTTVRTLWGELAWQLGGAEGLAMVKEADATGTSPGKDVLRQLLDAYAPCVVLMDELVVYIRQFEEGRSLPGGSYDSNLSFVQALSEAVKQVPTAVLLASLPDSKNASSGDRGAQVILAIEHIFGRVQAVWKPVATEEGFEIVRRRLFEPIQDLKARDTVCRAFADAYLAEGGKLPSETREGRYYDRLTQAYPIHPEVFDRLYEDWTTIENFQRTRGVLRLMAKVIGALWKDGNSDAMILPGSIPLNNAEVRGELTSLMSARSWDPVIEGDIDGDKAETTDLEKNEPRFGQVQAARRVARTLFLGTAPSSVAAKPGTRGMDRGRVLLGCLQPGQPAAVYADALNRLADRLHYLNSSGDKTADTTRFWFDTRANLRREMETRKQRFGQADVRGKIEDAVRALFVRVPPFDGVHVFTPPADVPDDSALRLVVLPPELWYTKDEHRAAFDAMTEYLRTHGTQPRHRANRLMFLAADHAVLTRLRDAAKVALAWASIVTDVDDDLLIIDQIQQKQAEKELQAANAVVPRAARECFRWLLCPEQDDPAVPSPKFEAKALNTTSGVAAGELERECQESGWVTTTWAPIHLRAALKAFYWKADKTAVPAAAFWEDSLRYLYLPRLKSRASLDEAIRAGSASREYFGTADGRTGDKFDGFQFGEGGVSFDSALLLIEPEAARQYAIEQKKLLVVAPPEGPKPPGIVPPVTVVAELGAKTGVPAHKTTSFRGSVEVNTALAKSKLVKIADEVIAILNGDPNATVRITLEIDADFPAGASDQVRRAVSENAASLGFKTKDWE